MDIFNLCLQLLFWVFSFVSATPTVLRNSAIIDTPHEPHEWHSRLTLWVSKLVVESERQLLDILHHPLIAVVLDELDNAVLNQFVFIFVELRV